MSKPTKFEDLTAAELYRSAIEDFAVEVDVADKGKKKVLLAALLESGVTWGDYAAQHPEVAPEPVEQVVAEEVVATTPVETEVVIHTATAPQPQVENKYLIHMDRKNVRFDAAGHKFTQEHPYALVDEAAATHLLEVEDGFRMATPTELREYYG